MKKNLQILAHLNLLVHLLPTSGGRAGGLAGGVFFLSAAFSPIQDFPSFTCKKIKHVRVCVCVGKRPNDRMTETKPNNKDRLLQHQQHQRYFHLTSTFKAHATPISLTKCYARTHARTACTYEKKNTQRHRHIQHSCYTTAAYTSAVLVLTIQQQQRYSAQRCASQRSPPQQPTTNDEPKKKFPATRMKQSSHRQHPHSAAEQVKIPTTTINSTDRRSSEQPRQQTRGTHGHTQDHHTSPQRSPVPPTRTPARRTCKNLVVRREAHARRFRQKMRRN